jgi:NNP family nitrate/nitrite transporter-like MFS transporter
VTVTESFWLVSLPSLVGAALRIPYTFAVPRFGGRLWTTISAALLLLPTSMLAFLVPSDWLRAQSHDTRFAALLCCAALAGLGGANFASSMVNISFFYPERRKGFALGLNAAGGNLGVAVVQVVVPLVVIAPAGGVDLGNTGLVWLPLIALTTLCAWLCMDSLTEVRTDRTPYAAVLRERQTWVIALLYVGTFGSFIGFSFAFPLVIRSTFPDFLTAHPFVRDYLAGLGFLGALAGSVARPLGGWLADRLGGARITLSAFAGMVVATGVAALAVWHRGFVVFLAAFLVVFLLTGVGNGATYRMIPVVFAALGRAKAASRGLDPAQTLADVKRRAAAVIGIVGSAGAFGGFAVQQVFRIASGQAADPDWAVPALGVFMGTYAVFATITWWVYLRRTFLVTRLPSLAHANA